MAEAVNPSPSEVLERIEGELRAMWSATPAAGETPKARAWTRNLVVVGGTPEIADAWVPVVDEVLLQMPARAIIVGLDPDGPDGLEANATAVCVPGEGGGPSVCSERVKLLARGVVCARLASCVQTLCGSDLPTTLVWLGRVHTDDPAFAPLAVDADRIVLDASRASLAGLAQVVRWAGARPDQERPGVADLAWMRLSPWQELCARLFDGPEVRELAGRVTRVRIVQGSVAGAALGPEGGLLLGWLATRLGWKATSLAGRLRLIRPGDGVVQAQLRAQPTPDVRGALIAVEIEAGAGTDGERATGALSMRGSIAREGCDGDSAIWRLEVTRGGDIQRIEQRVRLREREPARLLAGTLRRSAHDQVLAESVAWADELRGEELTCG